MENRPGIGVTGLLFVAIIVLKLCGVIDWPWAYIILPFFAPLILVIVVILLYIILTGWTKRGR